MEVLGILLAAGTASRFESGNKLLADLRGQPVVVRAARPLVDGPADDVVAVLGHEADAVERALADLPVETVGNPDFRDGHGTSVARAARFASRRSVDAAVFALGDMPCVDPGTVGSLVDAYGDTDAGIVVPTYEGLRGNPVLFGERHFGALRDVPADAGGRVLFDDRSVERVPVEDDGIHRDVDTPEDLAAIRESCE